MVGHLIHPAVHSQQEIWLGFAKAGSPLARPLLLPFQTRSRCFHHGN